MLVLFETPAGFALFKVLDEGKLSKVEVILFSCFSSFCYENRTSMVGFFLSSVFSQSFFYLGRISVSDGGVDFS